MTLVFLQHNVSVVMTKSSQEVTNKLINTSLGRLLLLLPRSFLIQRHLTPWVSQFQTDKKVKGYRNTPSVMRTNKLTVRRWYPLRWVPAVDPLMWCGLQKVLTTTRCDCSFLTLSYCFFRLQTLTSVHTYIISPHQWDTVMLFIYFAIMHINWKS